MPIKLLLKIQVETGIPKRIPLCILFQYTVKSISCWMFLLVFLNFNILVSLQKKLFSQSDANIFHMFVWVHPWLLSVSHMYISLWECSHAYARRHFRVPSPQIRVICVFSHRYKVAPQKCLQDPVPLSLVWLCPSRQLHFVPIPWTPSNLLTRYNLTVKKGTLALLEVQSSQSRYTEHNR